MALVSMCLNLMQEQLIEKCKWMAQSIGMTKAPEEEGPITKTTKPVKETPQKPQQRAPKIQKKYQSSLPPTPPTPQLKPHNTSNPLRTTRELRRTVAPSTH